MNLIFVALSRKAFSDVLERVASKNACVFHTYSIIRKRILRNSTLKLVVLLLRPSLLSNNEIFSLKVLFTMSVCKLHLSF